MGIDVATGAVCCALCSNQASFALTNSENKLYHTWQYAPRLRYGENDFRTTRIYLACPIARGVHWSHTVGMEATHMATQSFTLYITRNPNTAQEWSDVEMFDTRN